MDTGYIALVTIFFTVMFITSQRTEAARRRIAILLTIIVILIIRHNAFLKNRYHEETLIGFILAIIISFSFWLLIGKYNPVGSSDEIIVMEIND